MVEQIICTINTLQLLIGSHNMDQRDKVQPAFLLKCRSPIYKSTGFSPAMLTYEEEIYLPIDLTAPSARGESLTPSQYACDLYWSKTTALKEVRECNPEASQQQNHYYDSTVHRPEQHIDDHHYVLWPKPE